MLGRGFVILSVAGTVVGGIALAGLFASQVENKPWGVPDFQRAEYEEIVNQAQLAQQVSSGKATIPLAELSYDRRSLSLGNIVSGDSISADFALKNDGTAPLTLEFSSKSNEAIVWDLSSSTLAPMQTAKLRISSTANETESRQFGSVGFKSNDPRRPKVVFSVHADVKRKLVVPQSISFGSVDQGADFTQNFYLASETTEGMGIVSLQSDLAGFNYSVEPIEIDQLPKEMSGAKVAYRVTVSGNQLKYGGFSESLVLELLLDDELIQRKATLSGKVKSPISFIHPDIHKTAGLKIGTIFSKTEKTVGVGVRQRSEVPRPLVVLDHAPKELEVELIPQKSVPGAYQLVIKVREGTPTVVFNRADQRGFVSVGAADDPEFSEWFPIYGVIIGD